MAKADHALASAPLLLDNGDTDGACNRAYYAMFDAARAALMSAKPEVPARLTILSAPVSFMCKKQGLTALTPGRAKGA